MAWLRVIALGLLKWPAKLVAPFVVPFLDDMQRIHHPVFGVQDTKDTSYYNIAVRNSVHNMITTPMPNYVTSGNTEDETLEKLEGFQWRHRRSIGGKYVSFRMTWGKPRAKGKREFYVGWVMNEVASYARLTFFQLRIF